MDKKIRLHMTFDITASESFIKDLQEDLRYACIKNCFKNNTRKIISANIERIEDDNWNSRNDKKYNGDISTYHCRTYDMVRWNN